MRDGLKETELYDELLKNEHITRMSYFEFIA